MDRRDALKGMGLGVAGTLGLVSPGSAVAAGENGVSEDDDGERSSTEETYRQSTRGMPDVTITDVKAIPVYVGGIGLVVVKVETDEPGLYGVGDATFTQRAKAVVTATTGSAHALTFRCLNLISGSPSTSSRSDNRVSRKAISDHSTK